MDEVGNLKPEAQDDDQSNTPEQVGAINYPDGITAEWLVAKTKHLNDGFNKWFEKDLLNIQDNYKIYELKQVAGTLPNGTTIPSTTSIVDTMNSRVVSSLVPRETFVSAIALDPDLKMQSYGVPGSGAGTGDVNKQDLVSDLINESISTTTDFADKADEMFKTLWLENVTFAECKWEIETKQEMQATKDIDPLTGQEVVTGEQAVSYTIGRPGFNPLSMRMCAWDPRCKTRVSESPWFRKREMVSINGLFALQRDDVIENVDEIVKKSNKAMTPENPSDPDARQSQAVDAKQLPAIGWDDGVWELDTWWADLAWKDTAGQYQTGKFEFWVVGGDTVVKFRENVLIPQRIPVVTIKSSRKPGQLLAQGPVDVVKQMQKAMNNNVAQVEQLIKNAAYSPTFYTPSSGIDGRRVSLQSNSMIAVLDINGIKRFEPAVQAIEIIEKWIDFLIAQMREATAANDQSQGIQQTKEGDTTATEAQILAQGSNTRFGYIIESINAATFAQGIAPEYLMLYKQFGEPGKMIVKDGSNDGQGYEVQPEDLAGCYIFKPVLAQTQQAKQQKFSQLSAIAEKIGAIPPGMLKDSNGVVKQLDLYSFITKNLLPLADVQPRSLFIDAPMPPPMPTGAPGVVVPGAGGHSAPPVEIPPAAEVPPMGAPA